MSIKKLQIHTQSQTNQLPKKNNIVHVQNCSEVNKLPTNKRVQRGGGAVGEYLSNHTLFPRFERSFPNKKK